MAEFNCQCGKTLENGKHGDTLYVFYEKEILAAVNQNPEITLNEFLVGWRYWALRDNLAVTYWKCPDCGRVYEAEPAVDGQVFRTYEREDRQDQVVLTALADWDRAFVLTSDFVSEWEEQPGSQLLFDAIYQTRWDYDYFVQPNENMVLALNAATDMSAFIYENADSK